MARIESCLYHLDKPAIERCRVCGIGLCKYCVRRVGKKVFCEGHKPKSSRGVYNFG